MIPLFVDSDNALGARRGDVDDGFAVAALLRSGHPVAALAATFGNTSEACARANHRALAQLCGYRGPVVAGADGPLDGDEIDGDAPLSEAARFLVDGPGRVRVLALGPLTTPAAAIRARPGAASRLAEIICVGSNRTSRGRWPPWWPHEFNLTRDRRATRIVFDSGVPLTIVPLDVARRLTAGGRDLAALPGPLGAHLARHARRWRWRSLAVRGRAAFPVWDLAAALLAIEPRAFEIEETVARLEVSTRVVYGAGSRRVRIARAFSPDQLWARFRTLLDPARAGAADTRAPAARR